MVEMKFLGGCRTIGGSAISVSSENKNLLLDYGMMMGKPPKFPSNISPKDLSFIILSHCHADHSCGLPILYSGAAAPRLLTTPPTIDLARLIIFDTIKISKYFLPYERQEVIQMIKNTQTFGYNKVKIKNGISLTFYNAGHIPGSALALLEIDGKRILYTGDLNLTQTRLVNNAHMDFPNLDYVIIESTYALEEHPDRLQTEGEFIQEVNQIIENDGIVLVPAFGVSRSQEILLVLNKYNIKCPIYIDGMARSASLIIRDHPNFMRDFDFYKSALKKGKLISFHRKKKKERLAAMSKPGIIIAPSGMLQGGTAVMYLESLAENENNGIFLVSYQVPESPGRSLLDNGYFVSKEDHKKIQVDAKLKIYNFSSHSDKNQLWKFIENLDLNPDAKIFCIHGEENACVEFAKKINEDLKIEAYAPKTDEIY
ncbi:MAG: MBL fold metallo-hydrolase [Candidatus Helarchaeota archaeon]|nr:MBL fold metallo-hydrolase [Candidatus Helarchaeota archaeon]